MSKQVTFNIKLQVDGKDIISKVTADVSQLKQAMTEAESTTQKLSDSLLKFNQGAALAKNVSDSFAQITKTLNDLTAESRSYSAAMTAANTMAGKGSEEFAQLKDQVTELSHTIPIARDQLANGLYQVISNGVPENNWIEFLRTSARASVGGIADLGETVKVTSTMIKNYGLDWSEAADIQDKIQLVAKNGVTTFEEMAQALPRVASQASNLGVSVDELMASFATLTGVSGNTAEVSTQLAAIFTALIKPSSEATQMAEQMGIKFDAAAIKAAGGFQNFITQLDKDVKTYAAANGMLVQEVYGKLFGSAESLRAITPLTNQLAQTFGNNVNNMSNSAGTMDDSFHKMAATGAAALQLLNNKLGTFSDFVQSTIGNALPYLNFSSQLLISVAAVAQLTVSLKSLGVTFTIVTASSTLLRTTMLSFRAIVSAVTISFQAWRAGTISLGAAFRGAAVGATTLKMAIRGLMSATVIGAAITALGFAIEKLIGYFSDSADAADQASDKLDTLAQAQEQGRQAAAQAQVEIDNEAKKLKSLIDAHADTTDAIRALNSKYSEAFGYHKTAAEWYNILTTKSKLYAKQIGLEAQQRIIATQLAEKEIQLQEKYAQRKALWESGKAQSVVVDSFSGKSMRKDTTEYTALKDECRTLIAETNQLKGRLSIIDTQMTSVAKQMQSTATSAKQATKAVSTMTYEEVDKALDRVLDKMKRTTDPKQLQALNREYQSLIARQKQLQGLGVKTTKTPSKKTDKKGTKAEPQYYANPTNEQQLTKNINYYSGRLNGQDTAEQRQIITNIQLWRQKRKEIELTKKAALVPTELNTTEAVNAKLDYLRALRDASPADKQTDINHQIAQTELRGLQLQRPTTVDANSSDDDIQREITYQQKLRSITTGSTQAIDDEIKRLQRLKFTESEKLQAALSDAQEEFDSATTIQARVQASAKIADLQQQIDTATNGQLTITAQAEPTYITKGSIQDKRQSITNAQQHAQLIQSDLDSGIIDRKEAQQQIDQINAQLATLGKDIKPITLEIKGTEKIKTATDAISSLGSSLGNLGNSIGIPELNVAGTMAQAIATMVAGYATATTQAASMGPWAWIAFAAVGLAELASMISSVKGMGQYANGGIVPGTSYTGDHITARVNSGEMILNPRQQANLWRLANTHITIPTATTLTPQPQAPTLNLAALRANIRPQQLDVNVSGRISGRDLKLILDKRNTILSRS